MDCHLCEVYCRLQYTQLKDLIKAFKRESPRVIPRLRVEENGPTAFSVRCQQRDEASCLCACLTGVIIRNDVTGVIILDEERCAGCWTCILVCPFGAVRQDSKGGKVIKYDLYQGEEVSACDQLS
jgi:carbon-monoxide dehydrogenase iron sulfur subunit